MRDAAQLEPLLGDGVECLGVVVVLDGDFMPGLAQQQGEVVAHGLRRHVLHRLDVGAFGQLVLLGCDLLVPLELVVGEERLGVGERNGLRVVGFRIFGGELVQPVERRVELQRTAREGDVLADREADRVLQVVVLQIAHFARVVVLQQAQRTVEAQHLARQVERRQAAGPERAEGPVGREEGVFGHHGGDGLLLGGADGLLERQLHVQPAGFRRCGRRVLRQRRGGEQRESRQQGRSFP